MADLTSTFEVEQAGQKPRRFRFDAPQITIGFGADCDLSLEPESEDGAELLLHFQAEGRCLARPTRTPGAFLLNESPCQAEQPVKPGDVLATASYRIKLVALAGTAAPEPQRAPAGQANAAIRGAPAGAPPSPAPASKKADGQSPVGAGGATRAAAENGSAAAVPESGLAYLYLFFAPVQEYLKDDDVAEIMINGPRQIYIERKGKLIAVPERFVSEQSLQAAVMNVARSVGRFFNSDNPRLDARLPDGSRVHAVIPPLSRAGTVVAIRKFRREKLSIGQLVEFGSISKEGARLLEVIVKIGKNLIVSGATSSGKTSVLNVLSSFIPETDRILVLEDASELQLQQPHTVCFETRKPDEHGKGEVSIRELLHSALRLRPNRLVVGEVRGGEALDLLQAMNTGHEGSMSTVHSNSARDSLFRLETCALMSGIDMPLSALREQVASAVQIVIQTARLFDGSRRITAVTEVLGLKNGEYVLNDIFLYQTSGLAADGAVQGEHVFTGYKPSFMAAAQNRGFDLTGLFQAPPQPGPGG
jgi:pilus assembly protein CpaF